MGNGLLIFLGEGVRLFVNVGEGRFYAVGTPPIRVGSAMSHKDGLQVANSFGGEPHIQVGLVLLPIMAVLLGSEVLVLGHRFVAWRMTTVSPADARPYTGASIQSQVSRVRQAPSQNDRQVMQLNGLCLPSQVRYHQAGRTWYSAMARAARLLTRSGNISTSMGFKDCCFDFGLGLFY